MKEVFVLIETIGFGDSEYQEVIGEFDTEELVIDCLDDLEELFPSNNYHYEIREIKISN